MEITKLSKQFRHLFFTLIVTLNLLQSCNTIPPTTTSERPKTFKATPPPTATPSVLASSSLTPSTDIIFIEPQAPEIKLPEDNRDLKSSLKQKNTALILIDMQTYFIERTGTSTRAENQTKTELLISNQLKLISEAKKLNLPILLVEYDDLGPTDPTLLAALNDYSGYRLLHKNRDGLFDPRQAHFLEIVTYLYSNGISNLIIAGANGGSCVKGTIDGALNLDFNVLIFPEATADFNFESFLYPYVSTPNTLGIDCAERHRGAISLKSRCSIGELRSANSILNTPNQNPNGCSIDPNSTDTQPLPSSTLQFLKSEY